MYGKHFDSMYEGSMIGSGAAVFAVWGYCIAKMKPPQFELELNPVLLAFVLGEDEETIVSAIEKLCSPDAKSRSKAEEGRRLIKKGEYLYKVVNGGVYHEIRNNEDKRAYWRDQKRRLKENSTEETEDTKEPEKQKKVVKAPVENTTAIPESLNTPEFIAAWDKWIGFRKEIKKKMTALTMAQQLKDLSKYGPVAACAAIEKSISNGWQGLFPETAPNNGTTTGQTREQYLSNKMLRTPHLMTQEEKTEAMRLAM